MKPLFALRHSLGVWVAALGLWADFTAFAETNDPPQVRTLISINPELARRYGLPTLETAPESPASGRAVPRGKSPQEILKSVVPAADTTPDVGPRMDFDFRDTPLIEVIRAVQGDFHNASGNSAYLNVYVPGHLSELVKTNLVVLSARQVTVGELLRLLSLASIRTVPTVAGYYNSGGISVPQYSMNQTGYTFVPVPSTGVNPTYFLQAQGLDAPDLPRPIPALPAQPVGRDSTPRKQVQFFNLTQYLETYKVEDIITAVETGWQLAGIKSPPVLKFHQETRLLVASGSLEDLETISQVLTELNSKPQTIVRPQSQTPSDPSKAAPRF
jgi:hypothetical protein